MDGNGGNHKLYSSYHEWGDGAGVIMIGWLYIFLGCYLMKSEAGAAEDI